MKENRYFLTAIGLYINYIVHGIGVIVISQNQNALMANWNTDIKGVGLVISMLGIGRLLAIMITGRLSDVFGRKPFVYLGMLTYILFFGGILFAPNTTVACVFAVIAGIANSCLDSGTYPALMESFPEHAGTANVLIKAAVQIGQFIFPLIMGFIIANNMWFGWSFIVPIVAILLNGIFLARLPFPDEDAKEAADSGEEAVIQAVQFKSEPKMWLEGVAFVIYGFISQATFYLISQYINQYGQYAAGMSEASSNALLSSYSTGSLICVAVTAVLGTKVRSINLVLPYTFMSLVSIFAMWLWPTPTVLQIGSALVGFFAAGGVMQLGLTVMGEMFPSGKGTITGIFYTFGSIASFLIPIIASRIALPGNATEVTAESIRGIMLFDTGIAAIGFILAIIIFVRYYQVVDTSK